MGAGLGVGRWLYGLAESRVILRYLGLAVWPDPLVLDYGPFVAAPAGALAPWFGVLILLIAGTAIALWRRPVLGFLGCWFLVILAPTSSLVPIPLQPMAESRAYLPLAAVVALAVFGLNAVLRNRKRVFLILGLIALVLGALTAARNDAYRTEIGIWEDAVAKRPDNPRAHYNLAIAFLNGGRPQEAIADLEEALRIYPSYPEAHYKLGMALAGTGQLTAAIAEYEEALRLKPALVDVHSSLGTAFFKTGRAPEAVVQFEEAVTLDPGAAEAHANLGMALLQSGHAGESVAQFQEAVRLRPGSAELRNRLGIALAESARIPEAVTQFEAALAINPRSPQTHINLGSALANENRLADALAQFEEAARLDPNSEDAQNHVAMALQAIGRPVSSP